jgi:hypothetical protein
MRFEAEGLSLDQLKNRNKALETETSSMKSEVNRLRKEMSTGNLFIIQKISSSE